MKRAADGVVGHYCALAKREQIPFSVQLDLPECLPVDEINLCLVLSNLLEMRWKPACVLHLPDAESS